MHKTTTKTSGPSPGARAIKPLTTGCIATILLVGLLITFAFLEGTSRASSVAVVATVDKNEAALEDYILLKLSVKGSREKPSLPDMPAFNVQSRGSSSQVRIVNGQMSSSVEYTYVLYPQKKGAFTLGPFTIKHSGKTIASNRISIRVQQGSRQTDESRNIFVVAEVDNKNPHLYEQIIYSFKFYRRIKVTNARLTKSPSFEGFISEQLSKAKEYQKVINGQAYFVTEIKHALFPTKPGVLEIPPSTLLCDVILQKRRQSRSFGFFDDPFFGFSETAPRTLRTAPLTIMVRPLPAAGRPPDFQNLVGDFSLTSSLSTNKLEVGDSATLTLTLKGSGNIKNYNAIKFSGLQNFKVYDDKPVFKSEIVGGKIGGKMVIKKALVPLTEGRLTVPLITVSYFNTATDSYKTASTGPHILEVLPPAEREKLHVVETASKAAAKEEVRIIGKDILPIQTSLDALATRKVRPLSLLTFVCLLLPVCGFITTLLTKKIKEKNNLDSGLARSRNAYKDFKKKLPMIKKALKNDEPLFYQTAPKLLKDFIGDKLNIAGSAMTAKELENRLSEALIPLEVIRDLTRVLDFFDCGQFGFKKYSVQEKEEVFSTMKKIVEILNKKLKRV